MKKVGLLFLIFMVNSMLFARWGFGGGGPHFGYNAQGVQSRVYNLTSKQKADLKFMFEEEKLARDVYITLGKKWGHRTFLNIQKSEQMHMNRVKFLLNKYGLRVPYTQNRVGVFENKKLQSLYNKLVKRGSKSLKEALRVGVLVEQTDIKDLKEKIVGAPADIKRVYNNLLNGSYRHLRAFNYSLNNI